MPTNETLARRAIQEAFPSLRYGASDVLFAYSKKSNARLTIDERQKGHFCYIPYYIDSFVRAMDHITTHVPEGAHFIDVGSGIGDKVLLAKLVYGWTATGVEYSKYTHTIARRHIGKVVDNLIHGDAFADVDFSAYDLVYMYHPIANPVRMRDLFMHVAAHIKDGAIIAEMLPQYIDDSMNGTVEWETSKFGYLRGPAFFQKQKGVVRIMKDFGA